MLVFKHPASAPRGLTRGLYGSLKCNIYFFLELVQKLLGISYGTSSFGAHRQAEAFYKHLISVTELVKRNALPG